MVDWWQLVCLGFILLGIMVIIWIMIGKRRVQARKAAAEAKTQEDPLAQKVMGIHPRDIKIGNHLKIYAIIYTVRGMVTFNDGPWSWQEYFLEASNGEKAWLEVEEDEGELFITLWQSADIGDLIPSARQVAYKDATYTKDEASKATYTSTGTTGLQPSGRVEYVDYKGKSGSLLSFERFDGALHWELSIGTSLSIRQLEIYPR